MSKQMNFPYGEGLSMSQVWCDVLNFLVGILCIINGSAHQDQMDKYSYSYLLYTHQEMLVLNGKMKRISNPKSMSLKVTFLGLAYCAVTLISLIGFCLGKKFGGEKTQFWSRVWMFPILTPLFIMTIIFRSRYESWIVQLSLALLGYIWFLISLVTLLWRRFSCSCGMKTRSTDDVENIQTSSYCVEVENIYENDLELKSDLM